jgi:hypothetical protein
MAKISSKNKRRIDPLTLPRLAGVRNRYDRFSLDFLRKDENGRVWNGEFDVTDTQEKLVGVPTGFEEIKLIDYLVYRPLPVELLKWRNVPNVHPDSLDMQKWYNELIEFCERGVWVDNEYYNPFFVYWLNVFVFPVYKIDEDGVPLEEFEPGHPFYCNIDRWVFDILWTCEIQRKDFALMGGRGVGKAIALDELVPTLEGYKMAKDVVKGDVLFDRLGQPTTVLDTFFHTDKDMYAVTLKDGRTLKVCDEHLWGVYDHKDKYSDPSGARDKPAPGRKLGKIKRIKGIYKVVDTKTILKEGLTIGKRGDNRWYIPMQEAVQFSEKSLIIHPYVLGALLGDGTISGKTTVAFTCHIDDVETVERITELIKPNNCIITKNVSNEFGYGISSTNEKSEILDTLRSLGLQGHTGHSKFIPKIYLESSVEQRLELLKGLMDTDGTVSETGVLEWSSVSKDLADDFMQLCASLGIRFSYSEKHRKNPYPGVDYRIRLITNQDVFHLTRKRKRQVLESGNSWSESVKTKVPIVSIEYIGKQDAICYSVDNKEKLFQAGKHHIVTHNTFLVLNVLDREFRLFPNSWSITSSTNEATTNEAWNKLEEALNAVQVKHKALRHKLLTDSADMKYAGEIIELPDGTIEERGFLSKHEKIIYGRNSGKTRGKRPTKQHIEEFAAFPPSKQMGSLKACIRESRGSWLVQGSIKKCIVMYTGTGGSVENDEAEDVFNKPKAYNIYPIYDFSDEGSGVFIPTHIKRAGTWETTGCPDIAAATLEVDAEREAAKNDPKAYTGLLQEFPKTIKEVFIRNGTNIFNQEKIANQRIAIIHDKTAPKPQTGFLQWERGENGRILGVKFEESPFGDITILEHPHWLTEQALPDEKEPIPNLYVSGVDSIDQGKNDSASSTGSGSELAMLVKKRVLDKGYFRTTSNIYVAMYHKRSNDVRDDWDNALKLAVYYNSEVNIEYTKIGIVSWFRERGYYKLFKKRPTINLAGGNPDKDTNLIGTTTSAEVIDHQDNKIKMYIDDNYEKIWFLKLLEQLQDYDRDDRTKFDLVIAMGLAELADEDLMGQIAKKSEPASSGLELFGYYTDANGIKRYGVIPKDEEKEKFIKSIEATNFQNHGGVRWIDMTDPSNPTFHY